MGNYTKSFNFRNGVQVDDSNFIVNANGLVGIGTTIPEKHLDVRGNAKVIGDARISGLTSLTDVNVVGVLTVGSLKLDSSNGIINATKFIGDASGLTNIVAIATDGFIANAGSLSTTAKIGIGNLSPTSQLDVTGNSKFVGVTTFAGITTVTGETLFTKQLNVSGVSTFAGITTVVGDTLFAKDVSISGVISATTFKGAVEASTLSSSDNVDLNANLDVDGTTDLDLLNVAEKAIFKDDVEFHGVTGVSSITFDKSVNALKFDDGAVEFFGTNDDLEISHSGGISLIRDTRAGVGTLAIGANKLFLRNKDGNENYLEATDNGSVKLFYDFTPKFETIAIGASVFGQLQVAQLNGGTGGLSTYYGALRYGNTENASPYSTETSLDLINYDVGNINFYLDAENRSTTPGNFHWWRGFSGASGKLMTLTGIGGSLGIGITEPKDNLHVGGGVTVDGSLYVNSNVTVGGDLSVDTFVGNLTGTAVTATKFVGLLNGNVNIDSGISTFRRVEFPSSVSKVGIATTSPLENSDDVIHINTYSGSGPLNKVIINNQGQIGVKTDLIISNSEVGVDCRDFAGLFKFLVVGRDPEFSANQPAIDFRSAGTVTGVTTNRSMVLPTVNTTSRNKLPTIAGSIIYNSSNNRAELYNGTDWVGIVTEA